MCIIYTLAASYLDEAESESASIYESRHIGFFIAVVVTWLAIIWKARSWSFQARRDGGSWRLDPRDHRPYDPKASVRSILSCFVFGRIDMMIRGLIKEWVVG
jgi:hypothetical protein